MIRLLPFLLLLAGCYSPAPIPRGLRGKWNSITKKDGAKPDEFTASFRADGSYDCTFNGTTFVTGGSYEEADDTVRFRSPFCNIAYTGLYLVKYIDDSVYFRLISDSCVQRREGIDGAGLKRIPQP